MVAALPLRPYGMGVEVADLRKTATNAARAKNQVIRGTMAHSGRGRDKHH